MEALIELTTVSIFKWNGKIGAKQPQTLIPGTNSVYSSVT